MTSIYEFLSFLYTMSADMESAILHMIYTQIGRKSKNLSKNAMSEVHYSTKNLQPFASNYRSTSNTYNLLLTAHRYTSGGTLKLWAK